MPSSDAVLVVPLTIDDDAILTQAEWALLALIDGRRTVNDLVEMGGRGEFAVVSALAGMVERRLLAVRDVDDQGASVLTRRYAVLRKLETATPTVDTFDHPAGVEPAVDLDDDDEDDDHSDDADLDSVVDESSDGDETADETDDETDDDSDEDDAEELVSSRAGLAVLAGEGARGHRARAATAAGGPSTAADSDEDRLLVPDTRSQVIPGRPEGFGPTPPSRLPR